MRLGCCAVLALAACYAPKVVGGVPCDPANPDSCPIDQTCEPVGGGGHCTGAPPPVDANPGSDTAPGIDAQPASDAVGNFCLGNHVLGNVCLAGAPTATLRVAGLITINTASTNPGNCTDIRPQPGGSSLCLVSASTIEIAVGGTLRAIGPNPLVLIAVHTISVAGVVDVASRVGSAAVFGAGARTADECNAIGLDGKPSDGGNQGFNAGGGGAGGSLGGLGGGGGDGRGSIRGGVPVVGIVPAVLTGGCPGGSGGNGTDGGGGAAGGAAGGALYLLAGDSVSIGGKVNASGGGGGPGTRGSFSGGGGGGGGAGGMIGLESPVLTVTGSVFANGGGGGGGANKSADSGGPGGDPLAALTAALGGSANNGGGAGGVGSTLPRTGRAGSNASLDQSAGGGGGVIRLFGTATTIGAMICPAPT